MDFDRLTDQKDSTKRQAAFDTGDVNARGEPGKWAAPSRTPCRNNLARWRVTLAQTFSTCTAHDGRHAPRVPVRDRREHETRATLMRVANPRPLPARRQCAGCTPFT
ncbi:hypothetical protein WL94_33190 [Burkholderia cepacia]|uniref:hypothetical protein n=1 Tax=Burkholderia cepacia TaxID=292 RepID=UPI0007524A84|nr:hypothetical protein [Burkholderia cepacia]KWF77043.1 hypothetical protein WL94_33190 [Burkholderia cepacia]